MVLCHMTSSLPWFLHVQAILSDHANLHGTINLQKVHAPRKLIFNYSLTTCSFCSKNVSLKIEFMARTRKQSLLKMMPGIRFGRRRTQREILYCLSFFTYSCTEGKNCNSNCGENDLGIYMQIESFTTFRFFHSLLQLLTAFIAIPLFNPFASSLQRLTFTSPAEKKKSVQAL